MDIKVLKQIGKGATIKVELVKKKGSAKQTDMPLMIRHIDGTHARLDSVNKDGTISVSDPAFKAGGGMYRGNKWDPSQTVDSHSNISISSIISNRTAVGLPTTGHREYLAKTNKRFTEMNWAGLHNQ